MLKLSALNFLQWPIYIINSVNKKKKQNYHVRVIMLVIHFKQHCVLNIICSHSKLNEKMLSLSSSVQRLSSEYVMA